MDDITTIQPFKMTPLAIRSETSGELYKLSGEMVVGREVECDIQLASLQISRYHAKIVVSANGVFVEDLHSSNGTFVNGRKVGRRTALSIGDRLAFDDLVFRVTTQRSGDADETKVVAPGSLSRQNIDDINSIASDKLRPAAEDPAELERARAAMIARQKSKPQNDVPTHTPKSATDQSVDKGVDKSVDQGAKSEPRIKPIPADKAHKVHEIPDMEAFLKFAGSGLKPQEPLSKKEANPFGLSNSNPVNPSSNASQSQPENTPPVSGEGAKPRPLEPESREYVGKAPQQNDETRPITPEESAELLRQAQALKARKAVDERARAPASAPNRQSSPAHRSPTPAPSRAVPQPPSRKPSPEEEDKTSYVSLSTMDRYVETNARGDELQDTGSGPRIVAMTAPIRGKVFQLVSDEDVQCWTIGRDDNADVCIRDKAVSREHAWITKLDAFYQLTVNDEASEILVNGVTAAEANLRHGDRLQFGAMELVFRLDVKTTSMPGLGEGKKGFLSAIKRLFSRS